MAAIIYFILSYWAVGYTVYANKILIGTGLSIFGRKMAIGLLLGWILIPVALLKLIFVRK
ncbi:MAG: hypothetical protein SO170_05590 [Butyribacter sp.]|nr:hypothetical protein [Butyribacter sp.]